MTFHLEPHLPGLFACEQRKTVSEKTDRHYAHLCVDIGLRYSFDEQIMQDVHLKSKYLFPNA